MCDAPWATIETGTSAASLDIGSNTVRVLAVRFDGPGQLTRLLDEGAFARLGDGVAETGLLAPDRIETALALITDYAAKARAIGVQRFYGFATAATRKARNGHELVARIRREAGVAVRVIGGDEEAELNYLGAAFTAPGGSGPVGPMIVLDVGGGSTEFAWGTGGRCQGRLSCPIGSRNLAQAVGLGHDPVDQTALAQMAEQAGRALAEALGQSDPAAGARVVGVGGTVCALAAVDTGLTEYDWRTVQGYRLSRARIAGIAAELARLSLGDRMRVRGLGPERAAVIVSGAIVVGAALDVLDANGMTVDVNGVRLGAIISGLAGAWDTGV